MSNEIIYDCAVIIPIYKQDLSADEEKSLRQCLKVLNEYTIIFVASQKLNCEKYKSICLGSKSFINYEFFEDKFFKGIYGYSALMVCSDFYKRFLNYKYILIYQLDAFVFENNLAFWCRQNYDYVGGPVFEVKRGAPAPIHTDFFNGGFSLRKTKVFYKLSRTKLRLNFFWYLLLSNIYVSKRKRSVFSLFGLTLLFLITQFLYRFFKLEINEDFEWSLKIKKYGKIVPFDEALQFSFDSCPEYAFLLNKRSLPIGCHGWTAYYNRIFWEEFIAHCVNGLK